MMEYDRAAILEKAKELLRGGDGWVKRRSYVEVDHREKYCLTGAVSEAIIEYLYGLRLFGKDADWPMSEKHSRTLVHVQDELFKEIREIINEQYGAGITRTGTIPKWNDHVDTVYADVERVFDKAIVKVQEII